MTTQKSVEVPHAGHPALSSGIATAFNEPYAEQTPDASFSLDFLLGDSRPTATKGRNMSDDFIKDIAGRMRTLETDVGVLKSDVATIKERTGHMPTTAALWRAVAVSAGGVVAAMWIVVQFLAKPWAESLIRPFDH